MEAAAAAQIAQMCSIPFISIRIISNNIMNDEIYDVSVVNKCQDYVLQVCENMSLP
jgi:adenosylhomocysteine nucleosidase